MEAAVPGVRGRLSRRDAQPQDVSPGGTGSMPLVRATCSLPGHRRHAEKRGAMKQPDWPTLPFALTREECRGYANPADAAGALAHVRDESDEPVVWIETAA